MEALLMALLIAIVVIAIIWVVAHLCVRYLPIPSEVVWLVYLVAIILTVIVLLRVIWPIL